jgi:invasion protein IalB
MRRAIFLFSLVAPCLLFGARALEASNDPRATQLTYEPWAKVCLGNSPCFVAAEARGACVPSGGSLSVILMDEKNMSLSAYLATKRTLEGAIGVQIDQDAPIVISHPQCTGIACGGRVQIDAEFIERLKRSRTITVEATSSAGQRIRLTFSLADFVAAYDRPGTEPKVFEATSQKMQE